MRFINLKILLFFSFIASAGYASERPDSIQYNLPLNLPVSLSGSYGELRSTHFHSGVDFRIGGVSGAHIHAVANGYISRISVSPGGYGHAVYITHPDGNTSLYGHMMDFAPAISSWVRQQQYNKENFSVNLYPDSVQFPVKKGEFIGRAGNTGSSGGPHLHFEMRDKETQNSLNPLMAAGFKISDNRSPEFQEVGFYAIKNWQTVPQRSLVASYKGAVSGVVLVPDTFYVAVAGIDRQNNTGAKLAVYNYKYYLDDTLVFSFTPDKVPSGLGRYINSVVEYPRKLESNLSLIKSWTEPGCGITSNIESKDNGLFILKNNDIHEVRIELYDEHGNISVRRYKVRRRNPEFRSDTVDSNSVVMPWFIPNRYQDSLTRILLPAGAIYSSVFFKTDTLNHAGTRFHRIHDEATPVHNPFLLSLKSFSEIADEHQDKLLLVKLGKNGNMISAGGKYKNGWVESKVSSFGTYSIAIDTIPPTIVPDFNNNQNISQRSSIRFRVKDNLSGISSYKVMIDNKWILTSFDPKFSRLQTELKDDVINRGGKHEMIIFVTDNKGNTNTLKRTFVW